MKTLLLVMGLFVSTQSYANSGHRAGGDYFKHMPENSLIVLKESITGAEGGYALQFDSSFEYLEFDVYETKDNVPVVFHDSTIKRMIPYNDHNEQAYTTIEEYRNLPSYKKLRIKDLTLQELKMFRLWGDYDQTVPTLQEFIDMAKSLGLRKPMIVELKYLYSEAGRQSTFDIVNNYDDEYAKHANIIFEDGFDFGEGITTAFLAFKKKFKKSLGSTSNQEKWCQIFIDAGLHGVFRPRKHYINYCD